MVKSVSGIMLVTYVAGAILVQELGAKSLVDGDTVHAVQSTLDLPTMIALVVYAGLTIRLELFKPKYRLPAKKRPIYDGMLIFTGTMIIAAMMLLKYG